MSSITIKERRTTHCGASMYYLAVRLSYLSYPKSEPKTYLFTDTCLVRFSWLERRGIVQTFDDADPLKLEQDIIEIRELLNEQDEHKESSEC